MNPDTDSFDALAREYLFCMWPGWDLLPEDRAAELFSIFANSDCAVVFLTGDSYKNWEIRASPFHPALPYLSECHRSDYLRVYLMHHYGGGYTDVKFTYKSWRSAFEALKTSDAFALGYRPKKVGMSERYQDPRILADLEANYLPGAIGHVAFIFRRKTPLTTFLMNLTHAHLDRNFEALLENPKKTQKDWKGKILPDGTESKYPLYYTELGPDLFHLSLYRFRDRIIHFDIEPVHVFHSPIAAPNFVLWKTEFTKQYIPQWPFR